MEIENSYGIVYALTNPYMPGLVKIGMTHNDNLHSRMRVLYNTSVPAPFVCIFAMKLLDSKVDDVERWLHKNFEHVRVNKRREFFELDPDRLAVSLQDLCRILAAEDVTEQISKDLHEAEAHDDSYETEQAEERRVRRPNINFYDMGLQDGDELVFEDGETTCTVAGPRSVKFRGEECSLTSATQALKNKKFIRPTTYWRTSSGRNLGEIYESINGRSNNQSGAEGRD